MTGRLTRITTALAVATVAAVAAVISYRHAYELVSTHGETGITGRNRSVIRLRRRTESIRSPHTVSDWSKETIRDVHSAHNPVVSVVDHAQCRHEREPTRPVQLGPQPRPTGVSFRTSL